MKRRVKLNDLPEHIKAQIRNKTASETSKAQRNVPNGVAKKNESKKPVTAPYFDRPVRIRFHSKVKRLGDVDGFSSKAVIDGLVYGNVLQDDRHEFVKEVSYTQEKSDTQETIITIEEV